MLGPGVARGGGLYKAPGSQAQRQAETLFETRNVVEIREVSKQAASRPRDRRGAAKRGAPLPAARRALLCPGCTDQRRPQPAQIEARTRQDIADKSLQLRQRVGDSHRCACWPFGGGRWGDDPGRGTQALWLRREQGCAPRAAAPRPPARPARIASSPAPPPKQGPDRGHG
jgi:hypothetical protein